MMAAPRGLDLKRENIPNTLKDLDQWVGWFWKLTEKGWTKAPYDLETGDPASVYSFENEELIFPTVHHFIKFCLLTLTGVERPQEEANFVFFARQLSHLKEEVRRFTLTPSEFDLLSPNTKTCPIFRTRRDAEITKEIYRRVPILINENREDGNPWGISFKQGLFNMTGDSGLFRTREEMEADGWQPAGNVFINGNRQYLPLYEGKMFWHYDHRFGTYEGQTQTQANQGKLPESTDSQHADPAYLSIPRYFVPEDEVEARIPERWSHLWLLSWRDVTNNVNERTAIFCSIPRVGVGHTSPLMLPDMGMPYTVALLQADLSSYVFDYTARQKIGGTHLTYGFLNQLPVLPPGAYNNVAPWDEGVALHDWIAPRVLELTYTAWDLEPFARDLGYDGPPFRWAPERRYLLRCELDAAFFHLYGIGRDDLDYIMETFPIVKRKDEATLGGIAPSVSSWRSTTR